MKNTTDMLYNNHIISRNVVVYVYVFLCNIKHSLYEKFNIIDASVQDIRIYFTVMYIFTISNLVL